ncbi:mitochondrial inner-membrane-bound regulator-domain-containing protein [Podospora appendiculata]|uniref:Mitochondrial inner-membrane-bound regulator-domain-containing protein n=1 Tax=Podospora appendiculata TaxID=314037 RepID=A0AAE0XL56_9PEZI|nr:mitochondrial inner-membrane-bound regulator-domain-containing protein [Podospora appendiculata]
MLGRKVSSSFICLRCRLQLAGSSGPRRRPSSTFFASSSLAASPAGRHNAIISSSSTSSRRQYATNASNASSLDATELGQETGELRDDLDDSSEISEKRKAWTIGFEPSITTTTTTTTASIATGTGTGTTTTATTSGSNYYSGYLGETSQPRQSPFPSPVTVRPAPRVYHSHGQRLAPQQEGLVIDFLGSPGTALVMREVGEWKKRIEGMDTLSPDTTSNKPIDLNKVLEKEFALPDADEVIANIHELRPTVSDVLSEADFSALRMALLKGFTKPQLESYITYHRSLRQLLEDAQVSTDPPWVLEKRRWVLALHEGEVMLDPILHGYIDNRTSPKSRLAIRVMRECWDLVSQDIVDRPGFLDVKLRETEFALLTLGNRRWLGNIADRFLESGKQQIEAIRHSNTISIMAPKHVAEQILEAINDRIRNVQEVSFPVALVSDKPIEPALLREAERLTSSLVRLDPTRTEVVVTWIHLPDHPENFENTGEVVLRFLHAFTHTPRVSSTLKIMLANADKQNPPMGRYAVTDGCGPRLPWHERHQRWARFVTAVPGIPPTTAPPKLIPTSLLPHPVDIKPIQLPSDPLAHNLPSKDNLTSSSPLATHQGWTSSLETDTTAIYGHALHELPPSTSLFPTPAPFNDSLTRTFTSILPPLPTLAMENNLHETGLWHATVVLRFLPSPHLPQSLLAIAPALELRIDSDHRELKHIVGLRAVADTHTADVLFPTGPVDVRLTQTRYFSLSGPAMETHAAPLLEFLRLADLRPWKGKLGTPPALDGIRLPRRLLAPYDGAAAPAGDDTDLVEIDYLFASLEIERVVTSDYNGFKFGYRSFEAGQRGGRRSEVFLDAALVQAGQSEPEQWAEPREAPAPPPVRNVHDFMATVSKLARGTRTFTWQREEGRHIVDY